MDYSQRNSGKVLCDLGRSSYCLVQIVVQTGPTRAVNPAKSSYLASVTTRVVSNSRSHINTTLSLFECNA